ncbi:MAG: hypothetical protein P9M07_03775 [Candidatus Aceula meridiana]|nr:hypothetical protein [Candidatus Aceula meridiana]
MKKIIFSFISFLICFCLCSSEGFAKDLPLVGIEESWVAPDSDFKSFDELYIFNIDLRGFKMSVFYSDGEEGGAREENFDQTVMQSVAMTVFESYSNELEGVIPLSQDDIAPADFKNRNALILNIKVSGVIESKDDQESPMTMVVIEGSLLDSKTKQAILTFRDKKEILFVTDQPFSTPKDIKAFSKVTDAWAAPLGAFLYTMRR